MPCGTLHAWLDAGTDMRPSRSNWSVRATGPTGPRHVWHSPRGTRLSAAVCLTATKHTKPPGLRHLPKAQLCLRTPPRPALEQRDAEVGPDIDQADRATTIEGALVRVRVASGVVSPAGRRDVGGQRI